MDFALDSVDTRTLSEQGVEVVIKSLDNEPIKAANGKIVKIKVVGPDSDKYRALSRAQVRKRLAMMAEGNKTLTDEQIDANDADALEMLAACTVGWANVLNTKGDEIPCTAENARKLYENYPVVREQVDLFISNRANFLKASSKA